MTEKKRGEARLTSLLLCPITQALVFLAYYKYKGDGYAPHNPKRLPERLRRIKGRATADIGVIRLPLVRGGAGQLGLLLVLVVSVLLGPGDDVRQGKDGQDQVLQGLEAALVDVLRQGDGQTS